MLLLTSPNNERGCCPALSGGRALFRFFTGFGVGIVAGGVGDCGWKRASQSNEEANLSFGIPFESSGGDMEASHHKATGSGVSLGSEST